MSITSDYFNSKLVPRLTMGRPEDPGDGGGQNIDGYAVGLELSVSTDGYAVDLALNTVYELQARTQALYYGVLSEDGDYDRFGKKIEDMDDAEKLALLNLDGGVAKNGHYLAAGSMRKIASTRKCRVLVMKSATSTATVNLNPLSGFTDDLGGR